MAWLVEGSAVRGARGDSALRRVSVGVRGAHVVVYRESLDLPLGPPNGLRDGWVDWKGGVFVGLAVISSKSRALRPDSWSDREAASGLRWWRSIS